MTAFQTYDSEAERLEAGIYDGVPAKVYHADPCPEPSLSASIARTLIKSSPKHAWLEHPRLGGSGERETHKHIFDLGEAAHAMLLEGEDGCEVIQFQDWRTKEAKAQRVAAYEVGKVPLLFHEHLRVKSMVLEAKLQLAKYELQGVGLLSTGRPEQAIVWEDDGVWCRARIDWLGDGFVDDYKTTGASAKPSAWERTMYGMQGDVQVAFYLRGLRALGIEAEWRWIVQEVQPPYALSVCTLSQWGLELADKKVDYALSVWRRCVESGRWPGYSQEVYEIDPPAWEESAQLSRELADPAAVEAAIEMGRPIL